MVQGQGEAHGTSQGLGVKTMPIPQQATAGGTALLPVCVARQPIFDGKQRVTAYELLYGATTTDEVAGTAAAKVLVDAFMALGLEQVTGGSPAFISFPRELLLSDEVAVLPADQVVIQLGESVALSPEVLASCARLRSAGFALALAAATLDGGDVAALLELANIVTVDFLTADEAVARKLPRLVHQHRGTCLATRVATQEEFELAVDWGYDRFQGDFFSCPTMVEGRDIPGLKANYLRIMREANRPEVDFGALEQVVRADLSISTKLLKYLDSPAFGWRSQIGSIQHALVALGEREFRKWVSLVCLTAVGEDRPRELLVQSVVRANYCEQLASKLVPQVRTSDFFMVGLLSHLEAILCRPLASLLDEMPLQPAARGALLGEPGPMGDVLQSLLAFERSDWDVAGRLAARLRLTVQDVSDAYQRALRLTDELFASAL